MAPRGRGHRLRGVPRRDVMITSVTVPEGHIWHRFGRGAAWMFGRGPASRRLRAIASRASAGPPWIPTRRSRRR
jgi:hypothetical protein